MNENLLFGQKVSDTFPFKLLSNQKYVTLRRELLLNFTSRNICFEMSYIKVNLSNGMSKFIFTICVAQYLIWLCVC